jgi:hypothetical protein
VRGLGLLLLTLTLVGAFACRQGSSLPGHYVRSNPRQGELDLEGNGNFTIRVRAGRVAGTYEVKDQKILFKFPTGEAFYGVLQEDRHTIQVSHEEASEFEGTWVKEGT